MNIKVYNNKLNGEIKAIPSKSDAHRSLICSALSESSTQINLSCISDDTAATIDVLRALGSKISVNDDCVIAEPIIKLADKPCLDCRESGSTLRFILPVAAALGADARFEGKGNLPQRPILPLAEALKSHGIVFSKDSLPFEISGTMSGGDYFLPGNVSSQFISGLLMCFPLLDSDCEIVLKNKLSSEKYVDMTSYTLNCFGVKVMKTKNGFFIPATAHYRTPSVYDVSGDWSNSAFWLCADYLGSDIKVTGLLQESLQPDRAIKDLIETFKSEDVVDIDADSFPDLVPVLAVSLSVREGKSHIRGLSRLKMKESNRISSVLEMISSLGGNIEFADDTFIIKGKKSLRGGTVDSHNDHRIVMAAAIAASVSDNPVTILGAEAVNKSYPSFFEDYRKLGGAAKCLLNTETN